MARGAGPAGATPGAGRDSRSIRPLHHALEEATSTRVGRYLGRTALHHRPGVPGNATTVGARHVSRPSGSGRAAAHHVGGDREGLRGTAVDGVGDGEVARSGRWPGIDRAVESSGVAAPISRAGVTGRHPAHARLLQLVGERVEVRDARQDEALLRLVDVRGGHGGAAVRNQLVDRGRRERVHEPGLPAAQIEGAVDRGLLERLAGLGGVLGVELGHLVAGEGAEGERLDEDVEGARRAQARGAAGGDLVVAHVAQPDERDRRGKRPRALGVPGAELTQHREERAVAERVDLVDEEDDRISSSPPRFPAWRRAGGREPRTATAAAGAPQGAGPGDRAP